MCVKWLKREKNMGLYSMNVILLLPGSDSIATCAYIFEWKIFQLLSVQDEFIMKYVTAINVLFEQNKSFCGGSMFIRIVPLLLNCPSCEGFVSLIYSPTGQKKKKKRQQILN